MVSMLSRALATLRVWLGFNDPSENHPYEAHGWLLPPMSLVQAHARVATVSPSGPRQRGQQK